MMVLEVNDILHWMKSSGCSSGSTVIWFITLLLPFRFFSAYSIVAHLIRSVFNSTIAKIRLFCYWKHHDNHHWMKSSGCSSGSTVIWFGILLLPLCFFSAYSIVAHLIRSVIISTIAKICLCCYWKLHDNHHWIKSSGCSSGSTIMWFATLLLTLWLFSAYSIVAHLIRYVFVSTIAKNNLWWHWKLVDNRHWIKSSGCSSGSTIIWFATLLLPLRFFSVYSIVAPPIRSVLASTVAKINLWWLWKLHDNRHWMKSRSCSSGSTVIWLVNLILPLRIFSVYSIVAPPIRSVFVSIIAKNLLWWYGKIQDQRHWMGRSGCSSGSTIMWFVTLLLQLRFFSAYSIVAPPIRSVFVSTIAKIHLWWY
jgi:hypothetical protein